MTALSELLAGSWLDNWLMIIPLMFICLFINMPVWLAMFCGILTYFLCYSNVPLMVAIQRLIATTQTPSLLAIPFFILLGTLMSYTGIAARILQIANVLIGRMRGGLGGANILVSTMMGGVSASNPADAAMLSRMMVPEMEQKGYSRGFAAAITASGSLITPIIPPGIALILYGLVADVSIGSMFMADPARSAVFRHVDCHCMAGSYSARFKTFQRTLAKTERSVSGAGAGPASTVLNCCGYRWYSGKYLYANGSWSRSSIIGDVYWFCNLSRTENQPCILALSETARSTASVMLIIMASAALGWIFSLERAGITVAEFVTSLTDNKYVFY